MFLSLGQLARAQNSAQGIKWNLAGESTDLLNGENNYKRRCSAFLRLGASLPGSHQGGRWRSCVPKFAVSWAGGGKMKLGKYPKDVGSWRALPGRFLCSSWKAAPGSRWVSLGVTQDSRLVFPWPGVCHSHCSMLGWQLSHMGTLRSCSDPQTHL